MSKEVTFRCNLCREKANQHDVVGVYFGGRGIEPRTPTSVDMDCHLCRKCLASLVVEVNRLCEFMGKDAP